jgi:hypothetical protein
MAKKLTKAQERVWGYIKHAYMFHNEVHASGIIDDTAFGMRGDGKMYPKYGNRIRHSTLVALSSAGVIRLIGGINDYFTLTNAGKAELNATAQHEPEAAQFDVGDLVVITKLPETCGEHGYYIINKAIREKTCCTVREIRDWGKYRYLVEADGLIVHVLESELELWKPEAERIAELQTDLAALKRDRQRVLERNLALTEALEDIHGLVHAPETIADSAYPILLRVLDIAENALEDEPSPVDEDVPLDKAE